MTTPHTTFIGKFVAGSRQKVSTLRRGVQRRRLFTRLGRLSYERQSGSSNGDSAVIDELVAELAELDEAESSPVVDVTEAEDRQHAGASTS